MTNRDIIFLRPSAFVFGLTVVGPLVVARLRIARARLIRVVVMPVLRILIALRCIGAMVVFNGHVDLPFKAKPSAWCFVREEQRHAR